MITDLEARKIASEWHGGQASALYAFASTGAINTARDDHDLAREIAANISDLDKRLNVIGPLMRDWMDRQGLRNLSEYVTHHGTRVPQPGWSDLRW